MYTESSSGLDSRARMGLEVVDRKLQDHFQLLQLELAAGELRGVQRSLVVVTQQVLVIRGAAGHGRSQQMLGQHYPRSHPGTVGTIVALANAVEAVAGGNHPGVGERPMQVLAKVLEYCRMLGRDCGEVVEGFVDSGGQAGSGDVVAEDTLIHYLGEETRLRDELVEQVRNILLPLGGEGFLIAGASAKSDDDGLSFFCGRRSTHQGAGAHQRGSQCHACGIAQEVTPGAAEMARELARSGGRLAH